MKVRERLSGIGRIFIASLIVVASAPVVPAHAQRNAREQAGYNQLMSELTRLRQAAAYETSGNYVEAEKIVNEVLAENPASLSGMLTLERLLTVQNRYADILPAVERLLREDAKSVIAHQSRLRVLSAMNDTPRLEGAIDEWIRATPELETPYREAAVVWRQRGDHARALAVLEQGRKRINRADALALELGDAFLALQQPARAAENWARGIGEEGRGFLLVQRRLQALTDGGASVIPHLVDRLSATPHSPARLRAAALLAVDAGLEREALQILSYLNGVLQPSEREQLLVELARRAEGSGLHSVALQLYRELMAAAGDAAASLALRTRVAELALITGDTVLAAATYRELEQAAAEGSPQRRQAVALRIQLTARDGDIASALGDYEAFRTEFGQAPELDATAATLADVLLRSGDLDAAGRVLAGVNGARAGQLRGLLSLRRGDIAAARNDLIGAAPLLRGAEATATIGLATLLTRVSARGGEIVARIVAAPEADRVTQIRAAVVAARSLPSTERAALFDYLADAADAAGAHEEAAAVRREIVETLGDSHEAPAALLALARTAASEPDGAEEARVLLEKLIVEHPRSALAPQARTELQRMQQH